MRNSITLRNPTVKLLFTIIGLFLCATLSVLFFETKIFRMMADERLFLHNAYSGLRGWMEFDARFYPYSSYSKLHVFFLSLFNPDSLQKVVYLSKVFSSIPMILLFFGMIHTIRKASNTPAITWFCVLPVAIILLVFSTTGRIVECRPEAVGVPLYCCANLVLCYAFNPNATWRVEALSAVLFILAAWFTPRAALVIIIMAPVYFYVLRKRLFGHGWDLIFPFTISIVTILILIFGFQVNPLDIVTLFRSHEASLATKYIPTDIKFLEQSRLTLLTFQVGAAMLAILVMIKSKEVEKRAIATLAVGLIATQLIFIIIDPAPFLYAYSFGLAGVLLVFIATINMPILRATMLLSTLALGTLQSLHVLAPDGNRFGTRIHASFTERTAADYSAMDTQTLIKAHLNSSSWHIQEQIDVRVALCERIQGKVVSRFHFQPICLENALEVEPFVLFLNNMKVERKEPALQIVLSAIASKDTDLVIWGNASLNPHVREDLQALSEWKVYDGFALRTSVSD